MPKTDPNIGPTLGNQSQFIRLTTTAVSPAQRQPSNLKAAIEAPKKQELHPKNTKKNLQKNLKNPGITMRKQREPGQTIIAHRLTDPAIT